MAFERRGVQLLLLADQANCVGCAGGALILLPNVLDLQNFEVLAEGVAQFHTPHARPIPSAPSVLRDLIFLSGGVLFSYDFESKSKVILRRGVLGF